MIRQPRFLIHSQTTLHELGFLLGLLVVMVGIFLLFYVAIPTFAHPFLQKTQEVLPAKEQTFFTQLFPFF